MAEARHIRHLSRIGWISLALVPACTSGHPPSPADTGGTTHAPGIAAPTGFPSNWRFAGAQSSYATKGMVASSSRLAAEAGLEILRAGGNAVDAAVATGFALAVAYPEAGNLGGGGYSVIRMADGREAAIDYREKAPLAAFREMYLDSADTSGSAARIGRAASGVPGSVAGLIETLARYGMLPLERVLQPAIRMAAEGIVVDSVLARSVAGKESLIRSFAGAAVFFPNDAPLQVGARLVQTDLANTLRAIARQGSAGFYRGHVADLIVAEMRRGCPPGTPARQRAAKGCGVISARDLALYRPAWRTPLRTTYRNYTLLSMPPSSSGGITIGLALNILELFPKMPAFGSTGHIHQIAAAFQRAFIDRNARLGDTEFVDVPVGLLTSKEYARAVQSRIPENRATPTSAIPAPDEGTQTTHYSVVDSAGNAVATTTTINSLYGSGVFIAGAGFFMNNTMDDFTARPGMPNQFGLVQGEANAVQPGKRMLSAMSPTIVVNPAGQTFLVLGGRGGPRIITGVAQVIVNILDHGMSLAHAMAAPRVHHQALPDTLRYERDGLDAAVVARLRAMGYSLDPQASAEGSIVAIQRVSGGWRGMNDPRARGGAAVGY